ncbi:hypothetical protein JTL90_33360, partial [Pseudomonas aeruginosa]|nr:hypothetical protein [Pseudomonas aeruginosa]
MSAQKTALIVIDVQESFRAASRINRCPGIAPDSYPGTIEFCLSATAPQLLWRASDHTHETAKHVIGIAESAA